MNGGHVDGWFEQVIDSAPVMIWATETGSPRTYCNQVWLDFTGRTLAQESGEGWMDSVHPADTQRCRAMYAGHFERRQPFHLEYRLRRHDGAWRWVLDTGAPRHGHGGDFLGFTGSVIDITDMRESEEKRVRDLEDKAAMLQELHHRVRNNAQVFASLLTIQASRAAEEAVRAAVRTAGSRATAVRLAQEQMHDMGSAGRFDLALYVRMLIQAVKTEAHDQIGVAVDAPGPVLVPAMSAVPLSLIVNELLINALEHGFPGRRPGQVTVTLGREPNGAPSVCVADDGVGVPGGMELLSQRSSGMTIVKNLAGQIGAILSVSQDNGTQVTVTVRS